MMNLNVLIKFSTQYLNIFMLIQNSVEGLIWCYSWESCFGCPYGVTHAPFFEINKSNINTNSPLKYIKNLSEKNFFIHDVQIVQDKVTSRWLVFEGC